MEIGKYFRKLAAIPVVALGLTGCFEDDNTQYHFSGDINGRYVSFYESNGGEWNYLEVKNPDGETVVYSDIRNNDLKVDEAYLKTPSGACSRIDELQKAQEQFDMYLRLILEKRNEGSIRPLDRFDPSFNPKNPNPEQEPKPENKTPKQGQ